MREVGGSISPRLVLAWLPRAPCKCSQKGLLSTDVHDEPRADAEGEYQWLQLVLHLQTLLAAEAHCFALLGFALLVCLFRFISGQSSLGSMHARARRAAMAVPPTDSR